MSQKWSKDENLAAMEQIEAIADLDGFLDYSEPEVVDAILDAFCQRNLLKAALEYMYDSARELSCECFELGAIEQARAALQRTKE